MDDMEFFKRWVSALDRIDPDARAKVNGVSIALTGKFVAIDSYGRVEISGVDNQQDKYGSQEKPTNG